MSQSGKLIYFFLSCLTSGLSWNQRVVQPEVQVAIEIAITTVMTDAEEAQNQRVVQAEIAITTGKMIFSDAVNKTNEIESEEDGDKERWMKGKTDMNWVNAV